MLMRNVSLKVAQNLHRWNNISSFFPGYMTCTDKPGPKFKKPFHRQTQMKEANTNNAYKLLYDSNVRSVTT